MVDAVKSKSCKQIGALEWQWQFQNIVSISDKRSLFDVSNKVDVFRKINNIILTVNKVYKRTNILYVP